MGDECGMSGTTVFCSWTALPAAILPLLWKCKLTQGQGARGPGTRPSASVKCLFHGYYPARAPPSYRGRPLVWSGGILPGGGRPSGGGSRALFWSHRDGLLVRLPDPLDHLRRLWSGLFSQGLQEVLKVQSGLLWHLVLIDQGPVGLVEPLQPPH